MDAWVRYDWYVFNIERCRRGAVVVSNAVCGGVVIAVHGWMIYAWWHLTSSHLRQPFDLFRNHSIDPAMPPSLSVFIFWLNPVLFTNVVREPVCHGRQMSSLWFSVSILSQGRSQEYSHSEFSIGLLVSSVSNQASRPRRARRTDTLRRTAGLFDISYAPAHIWERTRKKFAQLTSVSSNKIELQTPPTERDGVATAVKELWSYNSRQG
jgi:hypothetical protein